MATEKLPTEDAGGTLPVSPKVPIEAPAAVVEVAATPPKTVDGILEAIDFPVKQVTALLLEKAKEFPDAEVPASAILQTVSAYFGWEHLQALKVVLGQELLALAKTGRSEVAKYDAELA